MDLFFANYNNHNTYIIFIYEYLIFNSVIFTLVSVCIIISLFIALPSTPDILNIKSNLLAYSSLILIIGIIALLMGIVGESKRR